MGHLIMCPVLGCPGAGILTEELVGCGKELVLKGSHITYSPEEAIEVNTWLFFLNLLASVFLCSQG